MAMKRYLVMLNANAGNAAAVSDLEDRIRRGLHDGRGAQVLVLRCRSGEEARRSARAAARGRSFDAIVVAGGDGSLHQLIDAVAHFDLPLGIIPMGTANDLASRFGLAKHDVEGACRAIRAGHTATIDLVRVDGKGFATGGGTGLASRVATTVQRWRESSRAFRWLLRRLGGKIYPLVTVLTLLFARSLRETYRIETSDGRLRELEGYCALLMNLPSLGAHFHPAPRASERDGLLDVVVLERTGGLLSRLRLIATVAHVARGTHLGREDVHHFRARGFEVVSEEPLACIADGELMVESESFSVDVDERALTLLVPALYADAREPIFSSQDSRAA